MGWAAQVCSRLWGVNGESKGLQAAEMGGKRTAAPGS